MASRRGTGGVADEARSKRTAQQPVRPLRFLENPGDNGGPVTNLQRAACCECTSGRGNAKKVASHKTSTRSRAGTFKGRPEA
jgi:hypothetical protein